MDNVRKQVLKKVETGGISFVRLQFTDILGIPKNVEITAKQLEGALSKGIAFDGSSVQGFMRIFESDMYLKVDPQTLVIHPWTSGASSTATLICDVYLPNEKPFPGDPRNVLRQAVARARKKGFDFYVGPEPEFFLLQRDADSQPTAEVHDQGGYFDLHPVDYGEVARKDIVIALEQMGFEVEAAHHEVAPSQHEIDFKYADALRTADNVMLFKIAAKKIALTHGLHATFMPKPIAGINGSGMHCHMSLFKDGKNAFYNPKSQYLLSHTALHFIAGLIEHIAAITAMANPLVNSYKRLVPGYEAPVNVCWARQNRSALIRVPASNTPQLSTRVELRSPDPSCNPYLAFAAILTAGLDGIERKLTPPDPVEENIYELSASERQARDIATLPGDLESALQALQKDKVVREALGPHIMEKYVEAKKQELDGYRTHVSGWELSQYLSRY